MHTLIENNIFVRADKYYTHQEDIISWFKYINPILTLQRTTREKVTDTLFRVKKNFNIILIRYIVFHIMEITQVEHLYSYIHAL